MRIAIIADIHEDFEMLEKAFKLLKKVGYDYLVCLGDITGYAVEFYHHQPNANACLDLLRENADLVIAGNHDLHICERLPSYYQKIKIPANWYELSQIERKTFSNNGLWLYEEELIPEVFDRNQQFLQNLPEFEILCQNGTGLLFSHFVQPDLCGLTRWFPQNTIGLRKHFRFMKQMEVTYSFVGHTHPWGMSVAGWFVWNDGYFAGEHKLKNRRQVVFCPPITGNKKKSGFIIFNTKSIGLTSYWLT
ncbi:MAG TPA: metallophosphoesterase [Bacteroidales bacterium]|nr:metallophosphoesterase [Bacteroidales bacterium]